MESVIHIDLFRNHSNSKLPQIQGKHNFKSDPLLLLNEELDDLKLPHEINESALEGFLKILNDSGAHRQSYYWLMLARIFELSLFCAGHYADNCEFSAAGDLLVNPRKILIHRKGYPHPRVKQRHGRISDQLNNDGMSRKQILLLIKREFTVEIAKPAILTYLFEQMQESQKIASWYLNVARVRMKKIADTIGFLSAWSVTSFEDFHRRMQIASPKTRHFVSVHLCKFDTHYFKRLGQEIKNVIENSNVKYEFLAHQ
jgi:hypothetical protein